MRRAPSDIGSELSAWMITRNLTEQRLADAVNAEFPELRVSQSWISRIVTGKFRRVSAKVGCVLRHAGIRVEVADSHSRDGEEIIANAIKEAWDGSLDGAQALALMLQGAAELRRSAKGK